MTYMDYPILFEKSTDDITTQGIGILTDCLSVEVTNELNEMPDLKLVYSADGDIANELIKDRIILADVGEKYLRQKFRITEVTKTLNEDIEVLATHILNDLSYNTLKDDINAEAVTPVAAFNLAKNNLEQPEPNISMVSSITTPTNVNWPVTVIDNARKLLGGATGSLLQIYKGEYLFDNETIHYESKIGEKTGKVIEYGRDLIQVKQEENIAETYTAIKPYSKVNGGESDEETIVYLPDRILKTKYVDNFEKMRILTKDFSQDKIETADELMTRTQKYIDDNKVGIPKVSLTFEMADIKDELGFIDYLSLGDEVTVYFAKLNIRTTSRVIKTVWDALLQRYKTVSIGDKPTTSSDYQTEQKDKIEDIKKDTDDKLNDIETNVDEKLDDFKEETDGKISSQEERVQQEVAKVQEKIDAAQKSISDVVNKNSNGPITLYGEDGQPLKGVGRISRLEWSRGVLNSSGFSWDDKIIADNSGRFYATDIYGNTITGLKIFAGEMDGAKITGRVYIAAGPPNSAAVMSEDGFTFRNNQSISVNGAIFTSVTTDSLTSKGGLDVGGYTWLRNGLTVINGIDCRGDLYVTGKYPGKNASLRAADTKISVGDTFNQQAMVIDYLTTQVGSLQTTVSEQEKRIKKLEELVAGLTA